MELLPDIDALARWRRDNPAPVLVPTMGNLHEGHLSLVRRGQETGQPVIVSIFVNPLQFGPAEDFSSYPRTLEQDLARLRPAGVAAVFIPSEQALYPCGREALTTVVPPAALTSRLCGLGRPGHFTGVATVVAKLLSLVQPGAAVFGEKDFQQLLVIRRMVQDLNLPVEIIAVPTLREPDGLAMSSRNGYLDAGQRKLAPLLYQVLCELAAASPNEADRHGVWSRLEAAGFQPEYLELFDAATLQPPQGKASLRWFAAARLGRTRLIDNVPVNPR